MLHFDQWYNKQKEKQLYWSTKQSFRGWIESLNEYLPKKNRRKLNNSKNWSKHEKMNKYFQYSNALLTDYYGDSLPVVLSSEHLWIWGIEWSPFRNVLEQHRILLIFVKFVYSCQQTVVVTGLSFTAFLV